MQTQTIRRGARNNRRDTTYGLLDAFPEFLDQFTAPAGEFNPRGAWKLSYAVWLFAGEPAPVGFLEIERQPAADGAALKINTRVAHANGYQQQNVTVECAADAMSSLRSLELESVSGTPEGQPLPATGISSRMQVRRGAVEFARGSRKRTARAAPPVVANWALIDALQRLSPDRPKLEFTLLDDGDLLKPAQRLTYAGKSSIGIARGARLALDCWEQTGYGVLPTHYWRDARGCVLFAVAGQRAFLYDPQARQNVAGRRKRKRA